MWVTAQPGRRRGAVDWCTARYGQQVSIPTTSTVSDTCTLPPGRRRPSLTDSEKVERSFTGMCSTSDMRSGRALYGRVKRVAMLTVLYFPHDSSPMTTAIQNAIHARRRSMSLFSCGIGGLLLCPSIRLAVQMLQYPAPYVLTRRVVPAPEGDGVVVNFVIVGGGVFLPLPGHPHARQVDERGRDDEGQLVGKAQLGRLGAVALGHVTGVVEAQLVPRCWAA